MVGKWKSEVRGRKFGIWVFEIWSLVFLVFGFLGFGILFLRYTRPVRRFIILLFIVFIAFALRVHLLGNQELRGDEGFSWNYIQDPIQEIVPRILREGDPQPPIHYWLLWLWVKFTGDSEFAMRAWSTMLSLILVPLTYHFARKFWDNDPTVGIVAASIMAIHPQQIWLAQDVRNMYQLALAPLLVATIVLPTLAAPRLPKSLRLRKSGLITSLRAFFAKQSQSRNEIASSHPSTAREKHRAPLRTLLRNLSFSPLRVAPRSPSSLRTRRSARDGLLAMTLYITCGVIAIYSHYYALFFLIAHGGYVLAHARSFKNIARWIIAGVAISAIFTPWVVAILPVYSRGQLADPTSLSILKYTLAVFGDLTSGSSFPEWQKMIGIVGFAILCLIALSTRSKNLIYPLTALLVPFIGIYAVTIQRSTFNSFYFVFAAPAAYFIAAVALRKIFAVQRQVGASLMVLGIFFFGIGLQNNYSSPDFSKTRGMRQVAARLTETAQAGDVYLANFPDPVQGYYIRQLKLDHQMQPTRADFDPPQVDAALQSLVKDRRVWHVPVRAAMWDQNAYVQSQLNQIAITAEDNVFYKMRLTLYLPLTAATPLDVKFENGIRLIGFYYSGHRLTLLWTTTTTPTANYTVFVHYLAYDDFTTLGHDTQPTRPTTTWKSGETIVDARVIPVPPDMPQGEYRLDIGLYDEGGKRLTIKDSGDDHVLLPMRVMMP